MAHLFVDISSHGYGHLAQVAPVLNRLAEQRPEWQFTVRSGLPHARLASRLALPFTHIHAASDFGFVMIDALAIDHAATAAAYRAAHANFAARVAAEADFLAQIAVDAVLSDVAYLPLAAAARAGIPALALCSLNWAALFHHYYGTEPWAQPIHAEMLAAYRAARFLRTTPGMSMPELSNALSIGPLAMRGQERRAELRARLGVPAQARLVVIALGGIPLRLPVETWPRLPGVHWLVPADWRVSGTEFSTEFHALEAAELPFPDLLCSVDAIVTKPGYGTFAEAACNGTALLYQRRVDWPEQDCLIDWLTTHGRAREVSAAALASGQLHEALAALWAQSAPPPPLPSGIDEAARLIAGCLD